MRILSTILGSIFLSAMLLSLPSFDLEGHRGCRGLMPENTIPAFLRALDIGVTTLEMDVVVSKDSQVVVSHDPYFNALFSIAPDGNPVDKSEQKKLILYQMNYADIKRYDVGSNGNPNYPEQQRLKTYKPLLSEVIEQAERYRQEKKLPLFFYNIEIKSEASEYNRSQPEPAVFCNLVQAVLRKHLSSERVVIQSFDFAVLKQWRKDVLAKQYPDVRLSALVENLRSPEKNLEELGFKPDVYSPYYKLLSQDKISRLQKQGIKVIPWTVNEREDMIRLKAWGVDGLITDYPNRATGL